MIYTPGCSLQNKDNNFIMVISQISENIFYCAFVLNENTVDIMYITVPISFLNAFTVMS